MMRSLILLLGLATGLRTAGQMDTIRVPYSTGFDFREGIYRSFREFRLNAPSAGLEQLTDRQGLRIDPQGDDTWHLPDSLGRPTAVPDRSVWGFCSNNVVYLSTATGFHRIGLMGALSHLLYTQVIRDWDPSFYGTGGTRTYTMESQGLLVMATGAFLPFSAAGMDQALADDPELLAEFRALGKRARNEPGTLFAFLRRYNQRHDLLFPRY